MAVYPPRGRIVHLYVAGYQPGPKTRSLDETTMCGATANETTPPPVGPSPTGRVHVPLAKAMQSEAFAAAKPADPRPSWMWCANCLGHAVRHFDLTAVVLTKLKEKEF